MEWINIKDFDFSREGEVLVLMKPKSKKSKPLVRLDKLYCNLVKDDDGLNYLKPLGIERYHIEKIDENTYKVCGFSRASMENVIALVFAEDIVKDWEMSNN